MPRVGRIVTQNGAPTCARPSNHSNTTSISTYCHVQERPLRVLHIIRHRRRKDLTCIVSLNLCSFRKFLWLILGCIGAIFTPNFILKGFYKCSLLAVRKLTYNLAYYCKVLIIHGSSHKFDKKSRGL